MIMTRSLRLLFLFLVLLVSGSCSTGSADREAQPNPGVQDKVQLTYQGPEVQAELHKRPGLHQLLVKVQVPSGGYGLRLEESKHVDRATAVYLTLEAPGPDEAVTMALEEKRADVSLQPEASDVWVYVRQVQRNVQYVQQPPAELAVVLARK